MRMTWDEIDFELNRDEARMLRKDAARRKATLLSRDNRRDS